MKKRSIRAAAVLACGALAATLAPPALAEPVATAQASPDVTVAVDPTYQNPDFEGWGTSLIWFANATGDYPDEIRERLYDLVFGQDGLRLNIARYNVGGGNAPDVPPYLRAGGAVEGWWNAPEGTTRTDKDWWDPQNPEHWNDDADQTQRWWVERIKNDISHWEAFSNSPPWFQTVSGFTSGGFNSSAEQIRPDTIDDFAAYMVGAVERLEQAHGIEVDTIDPLNEPNTNYWGTTLGADGNPTGGRQEGAHAGPAVQAQVIDALAERLASADTDAVVSAMDETNPGTFATDWLAYPAETKAVVDQMNVHTYGTNGRTTVRDLAKIADKTLWMSEVGGNWGESQDFVSMDPGLGQAQHIVDDLRLLESDAWVFWQTVEDYDNMAPGGETALGMNWGEIQIPFNCTDEDTLETCPIYTNSKFNTVRNFTHFIEPGSTIVKTDNSNTTAAVNASGEGASIVHVNSSAAARVVRLDLTRFAEADGAVVTPVVTTEGSPLVEGTPVPVVDGVADLSVPARSVVTFEVTKVKGADASAAVGQSDHVYRIVGDQSKRALRDDRTLADVADTTDQLWRITRLGDDLTNEATFTIESLAGEPLVGDGGNDEWKLSTSGNGTWTLINPAEAALLEVGGQATAAGSPVTMYRPNSGANQLWRLQDLSIDSVDPVTVTTLVGQAPVLPDTVHARTVDGSSRDIAVAWDAVGSGDYAKPGSFQVAGTIEALPGMSSQVSATVRVIEPTCVVDARAAAAPGLLGELPTIVEVRGQDAGDGTVSVPVVWDDVDASDLSELGTVEVSGVATLPDARQTPARLVVEVQPTVPVAKAVKPTVSATYTEPGYGTAGLTNGILTDKAWSNWKSSDKNVTDTLTATFAADEVLSQAVWYFYADGSSQSWPVSILTEVNQDGTWTRLGDPVTVSGIAGTGPVVPIELGVDASEVRFVFTAKENTHMVASEVVFTEPGIDETLPERELGCTMIERPTPTASPSPTATASPTLKPSATPTVTPGPVDIYSTPGHHTSGGRRWYTTCEPYSQTKRCRTDIWASQVKRVGDRYVHTTGWAFNNLTYLPLMTRAQWAGNPLAVTGQWKAADGRAWRTECDTALTGGNGCRSFAEASVIVATRTGSGWTYKVEQKMVFNNIVRFR